ncbi:MAG: peptide-methionine (S)-S-oxide reductase MsrA [Gammaproteobacteria bacterium]
MKPKILLVVMLLLSSINITVAENQTEIATFAGGCFWCMEAAFDEIDGVIATTSGYTGGHQEDPRYEQVSAGVTGHTEAIQVEFDPAIISYEELLAVFWKNIDPTTADRQFCDTGSQYRSGVFYHTDAQKKAVKQSLKTLQQTKPFDEPIVTEVSPAGTFYPAEAYHQDYYLKNPLSYKYYRSSCERDKRLEMLWGESASH